MKRIYKSPRILAAQRAISKDISKVTLHNLKVETNNLQVGSVLREVTGESIAADPDAWATWWSDRVGYRYQYSQTPMKPMTTTHVRVKLASCFAAGTLVATQIGLCPIELLQIGDLVLSQDTATGALSYEPIVELHHNPPDKTLRIRLEGETLMATTYHRFWRAGRGWVMARIETR